LIWPKKISGWCNNDFQAGSQSYQVIGVGQRVGLVKIFHTPTEAAFRISPGAETVDVQIAHRKHFGRVAQLCADGGPHLRPAVEGAA